MGTPLPHRSTPLRVHLTPSSAATAKTSTPNRSPTRLSRLDVSLVLKQVIGTTTVSSNAIDSRPSSNSFAFTAGSAAVVATVQPDGSTSQTFFRARPSNTNTSSFAPRDNTSAFAPAQPQDSSDSPSFGRLPVARDRVKAVTCVSFSADGRFLAVGETGHRPRVLIFSTAPGAPPDVPLTTMSDHTFGVRSVAFSPDGQYLASLGLVNDGFLFIWAMGKNGSATLCVRNKCTSNVRAVAWLGGCLVTVGTRHVKVWRVEESVDGSRPKLPDAAAPAASQGQKTLMGRNCVLGPLLDSSFTCIVPISHTRAVVCAENGDIGLLDNRNDIHELRKIGECGFPAISVAVDGNGLVHVTGRGGRIVHIDSSLLLKDVVDESPMDFSHSSTHGLDITALIFLSDHMVMVDTHRSMWIQSLQDWTLASGCKIEPCKLPGHSGAVQGVSAFSTTTSDASFFTWSSDGSILGWSESGVFSWEIQMDIGHLSSEEGVSNDLKVAEEIPTIGLATGDRLGILRVVDIEGNVCYEERAHGAEITGMAVHLAESAIFLVTASRDRTIQVFMKSNEENSSWCLLQTLDEHVGAITGIKFSKDGNRLLSTSTDRTLVIRELATRVENGETDHAFLMLRTLTFKATPTCVAIDPCNSDVVLTSTVDRYIHRYDMSTGILLNAFKTSDLEGSDSLILSSIACLQIPSLSSNVIAGVSSSDKSVRLYSDTGVPLARDWGHTEGVSGIAVIPKQNSNECHLVTASIDGTLFMWDIGNSSAKSLDPNKLTDLPIPSFEKESLATKSPLRRVISHNEMSRFKRPSSVAGKDGEGNNASPCLRSPVLKKRTSRYALPSMSKIDFPLLTAKNQEKPTPTGTRRGVSKSLKRSPSPPPSPGPSDGQPKQRARRPLLSSRTRMKSCADIRSAANSAAARTSPELVPPLPKAGMGLTLKSFEIPDYVFKDLDKATEELCTALQTYQRTLVRSPEPLPVEKARKVERELAVTAKAVGEKASSRKGLDRDMMVRLLEEHGERLVEMLGDRLQKLKTQSTTDSIAGTDVDGMSDDDLVVRDQDLADLEFRNSRESIRSTSTETSATSVASGSTNPDDKYGGAPVESLSGRTSGEFLAEDIPS